MSLETSIDLAKARWDIGFFCRRFLGFTPHDGQLRFWNAALKRDQSGVHAAYLTVACSAGNRAGKTLALAVLVLHNTIFKMGHELPDVSDERALERWMTQSFEWYHFAIQQETAELVYYEIVRLLSGTHEAQRSGCPLSDELGEPPATWDKKYRGEYLWIRVVPGLGGGEIHFRTTSEKAVGSLGKDMHGISFDECAFDPNLVFIVNEVLHLRRLSTGGQLFLISTPTEGINVFSDIWEEGNPNNPLRKPYHFSLRMSTRENIGFGIDAEMFEKLTASMPEYLIPQNIDGFFLEARHAFFDSRAVDACFINELDEQALPIPTHAYVQGVDPAMTFDASWSITLDCTDPQHVRGVKCEKRGGRQTSLSVSAMVQEGHYLYNSGGATCTTALDTTGFGGKVFHDLLRDLVPPVRSIEFGGTRARKLRLLTDLKAVIERGQLRMPRAGRWMELRRQLLGYKLEDKNLETDGVMALAVAISQVMLMPSGNSTQEFRFFDDDVPNKPDPTRLPRHIARRAIVTRLGA